MRGVDERWVFRELLTRPCKPVWRKFDTSYLLIRLSISQNARRIALSLVWRVVFVLRLTQFFCSLLTLCSKPSLDGPKCSPHFTNDVVRILEEKEGPLSRYPRCVDITTRGS